MMDNKKSLPDLALEKDFDFILLTIFTLFLLTPEGDNPSEFVTVHYTDISEKISLQYNRKWCSVHKICRDPSIPPFYPRNWLLISMSSYLLINTIKTVKNSLGILTKNLK